MGTFWGISSVSHCHEDEICCALAALAILSSLTALAQDPDHSWSRTYPVTASPRLPSKPRMPAFNFTLAETAMKSGSTSKWWAGR